MCVFVCLMHTLIFLFFEFNSFCFVLELYNEQTLVEMLPKKISFFFQIEPNNN